MITLKNLIGIKKSLGQLDLIAEELNNIGNQIKDVVGNSAIDMADKAEQAKDELGKSGNGYIEKLKARKAELEKSSSGYINNINKYRKHIF